MALEDILSESLYIGNWMGVVTWVVLFASFIVFLPFNKKSTIKPTSTFVAFIVASAFEMFGIPLSAYFLTWAFGINVPRGFLWGHTLENYIGYWGMYIGVAINIIGGLLIVQGWRVIYREYWSKDSGEGKLVTDGIYARMRHPQYTGFLLMTFGLLVHWATLPLLIMWPLLVRQYIGLAKKEEEEMIANFGQEYLDYMERTSRFIPRLL
jgi:protein-S-isoprenylcysteine O-methyltransferase Ste14